MIFKKKQFFYNYRINKTQDKTFIISLLFFSVDNMIGRFHFTNDLFPYDFTITSKMHKQLRDPNKNRSNS